MRIGFDTSPLTGKHKLQHRVRGVGFYTENLKNSLTSFFPENSYVFSTESHAAPIDILHIPYFEPFFLTLPLIKKNPTVVTIHDLTPLVFPKHFPSGIKGTVIWNIQRTLLSSMNGIIADSVSSKKDILQLTSVKSDNIFVVHLAAGSDFKKISNEEVEEITKKYGLPKKYVLYVGDVTWNKNLPRLIRAVSSLHIPFVMVGKALVEKGYDRTNPWNQDRNIAQTLCLDNPNIIQLGFVPNRELVALYNGATVFAMPSLYEGFGLPILEAMSCGCPVVTSKEGSIPEIAGEAAYYVDAYQEESIAQGIKEVYERDMIQKELSSKGMIAAKNFSWKKTAQQTIDVYQIILKNAQNS